MPNVFLGPEGSETTLPHVAAIGKISPWPVSSKKQFEKATMSDRSYSFAFFGTKKVFKISFGFISTADLAVFIALNELNQVLRYKNEHEEDVWYDVVITDFTHEPERMDIRQLNRYKINMTLEET